MPPGAQPNRPDGPADAVRVGRNGDGAATPAPPFDIDIESVERCGRTCRDVTGRLVSEQERAATGVTGHARIYPGGDAGGDVVPAGSETVGTLAPGEAERTTRRVELGMVEAATVRAHSGAVTIRTVVESDHQRVRFVQHRDAG